MNDTRILSAEWFHYTLAEFGEGNGTPAVMRELEAHDEALRARLDAAIELLREILHWGDEIDRSFDCWTSDDDYSVAVSQRDAAEVRARVFIEEQTP